jgi:hypothetical protein
MTPTAAIKPMTACRTPNALARSVPPETIGLLYLMLRRVLESGGADYNKRASD